MENKSPTHWKLSQHLLPRNNNPKKPTKHLTTSTQSQTNLQIKKTPQKPLIFYFQRHKLTFRDRFKRFYGYQTVFNMHISIIQPLNPTIHWNNYELPLYQLFKNLIFRIFLLIFNFPQGKMFEIIFPQCIPPRNWSNIL